MHVTRHVLRDDCVLLRLQGHLDVAAAAGLRRDLLKVLAVPPVLVICELSELTGLDPGCATLFPTVCREAGGWPGVSLVLCGASPAVAAQLRRDALPAFVGVHGDLSAALGAAADAPPYLSASTSLRADDEAGAEARRFAERTCDAWRVGTDVDVIMLVLTELVTNAVRHGDPPISATLRLRRGHFGVAVTDRGVVRPHPSLAALPTLDVSGPMMAEGGRGLRVVARLSDAWGVTATDNGGKTVWCEIHVQRPPRS